MLSRSLKKEALIFSCCLAGAVLVTFPLSLNLRHSVAGLLGLENLAQTLWFQWLWDTYLKSLSTAGGLKAGLLFFTFPVNVPMANFFDLIICGGGKALLGFPAYYNLKVILVLTLNAYSMAQLLRYYFPDFKLGWLCALPFGYNPYLVFNLATGRMTETMVFWLPWFILWWLKSWQEREPRAPYVAGILLGLASITYWYYGYFLGFFALLHLLYLYRSKPRNFWRSSKAILGKLALSFWLVVFFFAAPYLAMVLRGEPLPGAVLTHGAAQSQSAAVLEQLVNDSLSLWYPWSGERGFPLMLGLAAALGLAAVLVWGLKSRDARFWLACAGLFYLFSLGPYLKLGSHPVLLMGHRILLPYGFVANGVPGLNRLFWPSQYVVMVILALCLMWGFLGQHSLKSSRLQAWGMTGLTLGFALELMVRGFFLVPVTPLSLPGFYLKLDAGVVELPIKPAEGVHHYFDLDLKLVNFYQSCHGRPALWGQAPPRTESDYALKHPSRIEENSFYRYLQHISAGEEGAYAPADLASFRSAGYKYLVVHERFCSHGTTGFETDILLGRQRFDFMVKLLEPQFGMPQLASETLWELPRSARGSYFALRQTYRQTYRVALFTLP